MCLHQKVKCVCGKEEAYMFHKDSILPEEVLIEIFCPQCSSDVKVDPSSMLYDAGWVIHYDMDVADYFFKQRGISNVELTPEFIFDNEYCSWYGLSPHDIDENMKLTQELAELRAANLPNYMEVFRNKRVEHVKKLSKQGFRKAKNAL